MFKRLLLTAVIVAVGAGSFMVARAVFSTTSPATSSAEFKAGTININLQQHEGYNSVPFSMDNWMPGQKQLVVFDVRNTSTVPVTLSGVVNGTWGNSLGDHFVNVIDADYWNGTDWMPLAADMHGTFTYADLGSLVLKEVPANGGIVTLRMEASFDINAGNEFQGQTYTADIQVTGTQVL